jgi:hypothetical protein
VSIRIKENSMEQHCFKGVNFLIHDKIIFGGLIGVLGKISMDIFQFPLWRLKIIKHPLAHYAASMFIDLYTMHHTLIGSVVSLLTDYIYGIFWAILFVYLISFVGKSHLILKGLIFGAFLWFFSFGGLRSLAIVQLREVISGHVLYYLFFHLVFGFALGLSVKIFSERHWIE